MTTVRESTASAKEESYTLSERFRAVFRTHPAGVAVITADAGDGPVAMTATSVSSVSVEPNLLVFSASDRSSSAPTITSADTLVIHFIDQDDIEIAKLAARSGVDRFADTSLWSRLDSGEPYYLSPRVRVRGGVKARVRAGNATLLVVEALDVTVADADAPAPLVYNDRQWHTVSHASKVEE